MDDDFLNIRRKALCQLIYKAMQNDNLLPYQQSPFSDNSNVDKLRDGIEAVANQVMDFYHKADSYSPQWQIFDADLENPLDQGEWPEIIYRITYDALEQTACDNAARKNWHPLAEYIEQYGSLRTSEGRQLVASKLRGEQQKRGEPKSTVNEDTLSKILDIRVQNDHCSESEALKLYLEEKPSENEETVKSRIKRAKNENTGISSIYEAYSNSHSPKVQE